mmetsp:Transcript_63752/g.176156  ORF Transcript_63752/g.176156 Transcript_63752/m.176156 type:complete len:330 (+) Transcript_63752:2503-3492(+)
MRPRQGLHRRRYVRQGRARVAPARHAHAHHAPDDAKEARRARHGPARHGGPHCRGHGGGRRPRARRAQEDQGQGRGRPSPARRGEQDAVAGLQAPHGRAQGRHQRGHGPVVRAPRGADLRPREHAHVGRRQGQGLPRAAAQHRGRQRRHDQGPLRDHHGAHPREVPLPPHRYRHADGDGPQGEPRPHALRRVRRRGGQGAGRGPARRLHGDAPVQGVRCVGGVVRLAYGERQEAAEARRRARRLRLPPRHPGPVQHHQAQDRSHGRAVRCVQHVEVAEQDRGHGLQLDRGDVAPQLEGGDLRLPRLQHGLEAGRPLQVPRHVQQHDREL